MSIRFIPLALRYVASLITVSVAAHAQGIVHVDASAPSGGDGWTWSTAYNSIDLALVNAVPGDQLWVAAGTYKPRIPVSATDRRTASFMPPDEVSMYGGFDGTEVSFDQRAGLFHETVLDGDIGIPGWFGDNAYHVLRLEGNGYNHTVDGFRIQNGYADMASGIHSRGGAILTILGTKILRNITFARNRATRGGAIEANGGLVYLTWCTFESNSATFGGGAVRASFDIWVASCTFRNNVAGGGGGAVFVQMNSDYPDGTPRPTFHSCLFHGNRANNGGAVYVGDGGVSNTPGQANLTGCTFARNHAANAGGAIWSPPNQLFLCDVRLRNSIVYWNSAPTAPSLSGAPEHFEVQWSNVQGGWPGVGVLDQNPQFANMAAGDFTLPSSSPCIDAGDPNLIPIDFNDADEDFVYLEEAPFDLTGNPRRFDDPNAPDTGPGSAPLPDLGCHERFP